MNCETCHSLLMEFAYDELDERTRAEVEAALADCPECRAELALIRQTGRAFDNIEPLEVPAKLHNDMLRAARLAAAESRPARSRWTAFLASPAFSAALSLAILTGGGAVFYQLTYGGADAPEADYGNMTGASASEHDEATNAADEAEELAQELAPAAEPEMVAEPELEEAADLVNDPTEGRHALDRLAGDEPLAAAPEERGETALEVDNAALEGTVANENQAAAATGGSVTGAPSAGRGIADLDPSSVQRGGGRASAFDDSRVGNVASSSTRPTGPTPTEPAPAEEPADRARPSLSLSGNLGGTRRSRDQEETERSAAPARERESRSDGLAELSPSADDARAPGSAATIEDARVLAPAAPAAPEPEPEPVAVAAAPAPPPSQTGGYAQTPEPTYGQAGGDSDGGEFDGAVARAEAEPEEPYGAYLEEVAEEEDRSDEDFEADEVELARQQSTRSAEGQEERSDFDAGVEHYRGARYGRAGRALGRFLDDADPSDPRRAEARYLLGATLYQQGDYALARTELERYLRDHPTHAYVEQARVLLDDIVDRERPRNRQRAPVFDAMEEAQ